MPGDLTSTILTSEAYLVQIRHAGSLAFAQWRDPVADAQAGALKWYAELAHQDDALNWRISLGASCLVVLAETPEDSEVSNEEDDADDDRVAREIALHDARLRGERETARAAHAAVLA